MHAAQAARGAGVDSAAGRDLTVADAQAALRYHKKGLYREYREHGAGDVRSEPTSYSVEVAKYLEANLGWQRGDAVAGRAVADEVRLRQDPAVPEGESIPFSIAAGPAESADRPSDRGGRPGSVEVVRRGVDYYVGRLIAIAVTCRVIGMVLDLFKYGELTEPCCSAPSIASPN